MDIPYIYGAVVGSQLSVFPISHDGPCLHCVMPDVPETMESCDLNGILPPAVHLASSFVVAEVFYYLMHGDFSYQMTTSDIHQGKVKKFRFKVLKKQTVPYVPSISSRVCKINSLSLRNCYVAVCFNSG